MSTFRTNEGIYGKDEARICLNCTNKNCIGDCERLRKEKQRLKSCKVNAEYCAVCGDVIPEGRQVCPNCEK